MAVFARRSRRGASRWTALAIAFCLAVPLVGTAGSHIAHAADPPESCGPNSTSDRGALCTITATSTTDVRIDQPFVTGPSYEYQSIVFEPGDLITLNAGGCVQTGGAGDTWKRYVNPSGPNSGLPDGLYYGTVTIPGAFFADDPNRPVTDVPFSSFALNDKHSFIIPKLDAPVDYTQHLDLRLGYVDDQYPDDGYYNHDDGTDNQCSLANDGGSAWVTVSVQHNVPAPNPATHPKPFDLVRAGFDSNLLFKNPAWGWQVNGGAVNTDGSFVNCFTASPTLAACTSQDTTFDHIGWDLWGALGGIVGSGLCGEDAFTGANSAGHLNWFDVSYTGQISWEGWSGSGISGDDDYNMLLATPPYGANPSGVTDQNPGAVKLEFDSDETIDNFDQEPWWNQLHGAVGAEPLNFHNNGPVEQMIDNHDAVVIGLMGLDTEHGAASEIHPVHLIAIRESAPGSIDPANDAWAIFARNWGDEGECGSQQHYLDAGTITLDLPRPGNVAPTATGLPTSTTFLAHGTNVGPAIHPSTQGVQITFNLPNGANQPFEVGEVHLNWTGNASATASATASKPAAPAIAKPAAAVRPTDDPGDDGNGEAEAILDNIWQGMTPAQQQLGSAIFDQLRPHVTRPATPVTATLSSTAPPMPTSVPTVSTGPDPVSLQRVHAQFQAFCAATDGNLPTQPGWCASLNQPPITTLATTGGSPVVKGWNTTPVTATLTAHDATGSGINRTEYSYDGQTWTTYTGPFTLPDGGYTLSYRSVDNKNNIEQPEQRAFRIDTRPPAITITQPTATQYPHSGTLTLDYGAQDGPATGLNAGSGVASVTATLDGASTLAGHGLASGQTINLLTELSLGQHTFTVQATDNVGHTSTSTVTFDIIVTPESIEDDVRQFAAAGDIHGPAVAQLLLTQLDTAELAWNSGLCLVADVDYDAFATEVQTLSGLTISPAAATILAGDARYLATHCAASNARTAHPR